MEQENNEIKNEENAPTSEKKKLAMSIPAAIITAAVIIGIALIVSFGPRKEVASEKTAPQAPEQEVTSVPKEVATLRTDDYIQGNRNAEVLLIEYADSDCVYCQRFSPTIQQILKDYDGKVAWIYRHFPLTSIHPNAYTEALALECVGEIGGNEKFHSYLATLMNVTLSPDPKSNKALLTYASDIGINQAKLTACIEGEEASKRIDASINEAAKIGAKGTPFSILVNQKTGKQVIIPGAYPIEAVREMIDSIL
jgi:protein-disulfide isomerase